MNLSKDDLISKVDFLKKQKILVIGDVGLDEYVMGPVRRISPEAPVPILEVESNEYRLGLTSNVAANIMGLGGDALLVGVVGNDQPAEILKGLLKDQGCTTEHLILTPDRPTTRKLRVISGQHHIVRIDFEKKKFLSPIIQAALLKKISDLIPVCDGIILEDYAKGVLSREVIQSTLQIAKRAGKFVALDPNKQTPIDYYTGVDYMTPNTDEAIALSGLKLDDLRNPSENFQEVGAELLKLSKAQAIVVTRGKQGMSAFITGGSKEGVQIPTFARSVFDVTGAGDTVIATLALALASGFDLKTCCLLSNFAAGIVVGKVGCVFPTNSELKAYIKSHG